jgi:hypothetical protein
MIFAHIAARYLSHYKAAQGHLLQSINGRP